MIVATTPYRRWTPEEDAYLRANYAAGGAAVARALGIPDHRVYNRAHRLGLGHQPRTTIGEAFRAELRRLHGLGWADPEIADRLGCERHTASRHRRAMGLGSNRFHPRQRARVAANTADQCKAVGVRSLAEVRAAAFRRFASESGWPPDLRPRHVHILDALESRGPMTRAEIAMAIGLEWRGSRRSLKSNGVGGSYLSQLMARGLVISLGRVVRGDGSGHSVNLYSLSLTTERAVDRG